jgi:hypothetical protein
MQKKEQKSPVIHPSLAGGNLPPAQKGKSRIAPGAQRGYVVGDRAPTPPMKVPVIGGPVAPVIQDARRSEPTDESVDIAAALAAAAPEAPDALTAVDPALAAAAAKRANVMDRLVGFSQPLFKQATIGGMNFRFKILSPSENMHVSKILSAMDPEDQTIFRSRVLRVAAGLVDIDGVTLESLYRGELRSDVVLMRYSEIMNWSSPILDSVLEAYEQILKTVREEFQPDFLTQPKTATKG